MSDPRSPEAQPCIDDADDGDDFAAETARQRLADQIAFGTVIGTLLGLFSDRYGSARAMEFGRNLLAELGPVFERVERDPTMRARVESVAADLTNVIREVA